MLVTTTVRVLLVITFVGTHVCSITSDIDETKSLDESCRTVPNNRSPKPSIGLGLECRVLVFVVGSWVLCFGRALWSWVFGLWSLVFGLGLCSSSWSLLVELFLR